MTCRTGSSAWATKAVAQGRHRRPGARGKPCSRVCRRQHVPFLNGLAHFLPNTKLDEVNTQLKKLETEFWQAKSQFIERYARLRDDAVLEWRQMAEKVSNNPDRLMATIEASFPPAPQLERSFAFGIQLFQIAVPERLGLDMITVGDQQNLVTARQQAAQEAANRIHQETERLVADCVASLREQTAAVCDEMLESIRTSETGVHQKTLNRLVRFIDQFRQMNFAGDSQMEQQLETVRRELLSRTAEQYRDDTFARERLVNGLNRLANEARQLASRMPPNLCNDLENSGEGSSTWRRSKSRNQPEARRATFLPRLSTITQLLSHPRRSGYRRCRMSGTDHATWKLS